MASRKKSPAAFAFKEDFERAGSNNLPPDKKLLKKKARAGEKSGNYTEIDNLGPPHFQERRCGAVEITIITLCLQYTRCRGTCRNPELGKVTVVCVCECVKVSFSFTLCFIFLIENRPIRKYSSMFLMVKCSREKNVQR